MQIRSMLMHFIWSRKLQFFFSCAVQSSSCQQICR